METKFNDVLYQGMTGQAFKLGTVLFRGEFWSRINGCKCVYTGQSLEDVDFEKAFAVFETDQEFISLDMISFEQIFPLVYVLRNVNCCGEEERSLDCSLGLHFDDDKNIKPSKPNGLLDMELTRISSDSIYLSWYFSPVDQKDEVLCFLVYWNEGTGEIDCFEPTEVIDYKGTGNYGVGFNCSAGKNYKICVKAVGNNSQERYVTAGIVTNNPETKTSFFEIIKNLCI